MNLEILFGGIKIAALLLAFLTFLGYGASRFLMSGPWAPYRLIGAPFVGWALAVSVSYLLNATLLGMNQIIWVLVGVGVVGNVAAFFGRDRVAAIRQDRRVLVAVALGIGLLVVALVPHANDSSLGLISLNVDEELYWPYAEHIKHFPASMEGAGHSPFLNLFEAPDFRSRGQGFVYLLSLASLVSFTPTFLAYMPLVYLLLGLSVVSTFLFARVGLGLGRGTSSLAAGLYAANGLPLWFAGMGFGPHMVALALLPLALAGLIVAADRGQAGPIGFGGLVGAVLLTSYFWAISAVFLVSASFLAAGLVALRPDRIRRVRRLLAVAAVALATGAVGFFWLFRWALPQMGSITGNLDSSFGNAWGDLTFPPFQLVPGIQTYHMVFDRSGVMAAIPDAAWDLLDALEQPIWVAFLMLSAVALLRMRGSRLAATMLALGFGLFMLWVYRVAGYQYGHFKNLSYVSFFADTLVAAGLMSLWIAGRARFAGLVSDAAWRRWWGRGLRAFAAITLLALLALSGRNSLHTFRWYWLGFSWNLPHQVVEDVRRVADLIPVGATVAVSADVEYPLLPESIKYRPITLAFHYESTAIKRWSGRLKALLAAELPGRDLFLPDGTTAFAADPGLIPENPDFLVLGRDEDPRLHGLVAADNLTPEAVIGLYRFPDEKVVSRDEIVAIAGSGGALLPDRPLVIGVGADDLSHDQAQPHSTAVPALRQVLLGVVNVITGTVVVEIGFDGEPDSLLLSPGLNWIVTDRIPAGSNLTLTTVEVGAVVPVVARLLNSESGATAGVTTDPRTVVWAHAEVVGRSIWVDLTITQPQAAGRNVGVSYHEDATRGFWVSGLTLPLGSREVRLKYFVDERRLEEAIDGTPSRSGVAREADGTGRREFELVFAHRDEVDWRVTLFEYQVSDGQLQIVSIPEAPSVFPLRDR